MISISYIISVYNQENYLKDLLLCLQNQVGEFDREYIFIDAGSSDESLKVIDELTNKMTNVHIVSQHHTNLSRAINTGIKLAKGNYVMIINASDLLLGDATETLIKLKQATGYKIVRAIYGNTYPMYEKFNHKVTLKDNTLKALLKSSPQAESGNYLIERSLLHRINYCDENVNAWYYSLFLRLSIKTPIATINKLVSYRAAADKLPSTTHDNSLARYNFIMDNLWLNQQIKIIALNQQVKEAWSFYCKGLRIDQSFNSLHFFRYLVTRGCLFNFEDELLLKWMREALLVYSVS
jgi:glycosyltransferase involved in cell wall biosynthesis